MSLVYLCWDLWSKSGTRFYIGFWGGQLRSIDWTTSNFEYIIASDFFSTIEISWVEVGIDDNRSKLKSFMWGRLWVPWIYHWLSIKLKLSLHNELIIKMLIFTIQKHLLFYFVLFLFVIFLLQVLLCYHEGRYLSIFMSNQKYLYWKLIDGS